MKVIIAGGRDFNNEQHVITAMEAFRKSYGRVTEVVCGMAKGADTLGWKYAHFRQIPIKEFYANWDKHGKSAGVIRNGEMANYADALVAFWDRKSKGTQNMIKQAMDKGLITVIVEY